PQEERIFNPSRETRRILAQARSIGAETERLCQLLFAVEGRVGQRKLWGIVGLAQRYPHALLERACAQALADGVHSYQHVKALADRLVAQELARLDQCAPTQGELDLVQEHPLIRAANVYAELFARCTAQATSMAAATAPSAPASIRATQES
ncbi:MAG TPA: IS21 family transposase, partial [Roseateles sp.]|nr:IS21 family transposase [Roseateles sp.]